MDAADVYVSSTHTHFVYLYAYTPCSTKKQGEENKLQAMLSPWNVCDVLAFLPPLLETLLVVCGTSWAPGSLLRGYDMRFFKLLRYEGVYGVY